MKKFFANLKRFRAYISYSAVASLKQEVSGSYFSWLWWILDPFLFMMVYCFVFVVVFEKTEEHLIPFIFVGYGTWSYFSRNVSQSVKLIRGNKSILSRVYLPKYVLLSSMMIENLIRYLIIIALCFIVSIFDHVRFSWKVLYFIPLTGGLMLLVFGFCSILLHLGVYMKDLGNITTVVLKLIFYLSGVFYNLEKRVPKPYNMWLSFGKPVAMYMSEIRRVILYRKDPRFWIVGVWIGISLILSFIGISLIHKHEQTYVKAI